MKFWNTPVHGPAFRYARDHTAYHSRSFFASACLLPSERRWATFALYGFCRYADNLIDLPRNRTTAERVGELEALRSELAIAYRTGESEHPVLRPFILTAHRYGIPEEYPRDLLAGVEMDLQRHAYDTFEELYLFCYRVAGVVGLMMTHVLGYRDEAAFHYAEKLGIAMQLTNILRDVQEDKNLGRIYLPLEDLRRFGVPADDIRAERWTPAARRLMRYQVERAEGYYRDAEPGIALLEKPSRFAIYSAARIYGGILRKIRARDFNPFLGRVVVSQREKVGTVWREFLRTRLMPDRARRVLPNPPAGITRGLLDPMKPVRS